MKQSIFELETGVAYINDDHIITCHICGKTFSPIKSYIIPTDLCAFYSGTYKRMAAIYYLSDNICEHVKFFDNWGCIFLGDIESLPFTILSKFEDILLQQPSYDQAKEAWDKTMAKFKESKRISV